MLKLSYNCVNVYFSFWFCQLLLNMVWNYVIRYIYKRPCYIFLLNLLLVLNASISSNIFVSKDVCLILIQLLPSCENHLLAGSHKIHFFPIFALLGYVYYIFVVALITQYICTLFLSCLQSLIINWNFTLA